MLYDDEVKLSFKVMINKQKNKVLFAEADSDFADVLLSFLTLPLGKIVRLVNNHYGDDEAPDIGSLTTLYRSLAILLDGPYFWTPGGREMLLDPGSSFRDECSKLKINIDDTEPTTKYFRCGNMECSRKKRSPLISMYHDQLKCDCGEYMNKPMSITGPAGIDQDDDGGAFVKKGLSFLITDDLQMAPVVPGSIIQTLLSFGVTVTQGAQLRIVSFGLNEIMDLLRASLLSSTPLTDVVFHHTRDKMDGVTGDLLSQTMESLSDSKNMIVKAWVYAEGKLQNRSFALEAKEDFVDFLLSLLVIPLGGVEWLLGGHTGLRSIDNLYRSVKDCFDDDCFTTSDMKSRLMKPKLPPGCLSKNQMFPLEEEPNPKVCYFEGVATGDSNTTKEIGSWMQLKDPKGGESYVKSSETFFVLDCLTGLLVSCDCKEVRKILKICSEHKQLELQIGLREALEILGTCLTSTSATSDGLANLITEKLNSKT